MGFRLTNDFIMSQNGEAFIWILDLYKKCGCFHYANCDAPTRHMVLSEGSFFFFFFHINFKLVHSYNVQQLTCIIFCSSGLQNIYTSSL